MQVTNSCCIHLYGDSYEVGAWSGCLGWVLCDRITVFLFGLLVINHSVYEFN